MDVWSEHWDAFGANSRAFATMKRVALEVAPFVDEPDALERYARQNQLTINEIIYYFNAFEYGGDEGLEAIRNPDIIPPDLARRIIRQIEKVLTATDVVPCRVTDEGTVIGIYQVMTRTSDDRYLHPVCQFRVTLADVHFAVEVSVY